MAKTLEELKKEKSRIEDQIYSIRKKQNNLSDELDHVKAAKKEMVDIVEEAIYLQERVGRPALDYLNRFWDSKRSRFFLNEVYEYNDNEIGKYINQLRYIVVILGTEVERINSKIKKNKSNLSTLNVDLNSIIYKIAHY